MIKAMALFIGGGIGASLRYLIGGWTYRLTGGLFPWGTLAVNLISGFAIGFLWDLFETRIVSPNLRTFVFIGVIGGFSTFSSYALETVNLAREGEMGLALWNVLLSNAMCIVLVYAGFVASRYLKTLF